MIPFFMISSFLFASSAAKVSLKSTSLTSVECPSYPGPWCENGIPLEYTFKDCANNQEKKCLEENSMQATTNKSQLREELFKNMKLDIDIKPSANLDITATKNVSPETPLIPNVYVTTFPDGLKIIRHGAPYKKQDSEIEKFFLQYGTPGRQHMFSWITYGNDVKKERSMEVQQTKVWKNLSDNQPTPFRLILNVAGATDVNILPPARAVAKGILSLPWYSWDPNVVTDVKQEMKKKDEEFSPSLGASDLSSASFLLKNKYGLKEHLEKQSLIPSYQNLAMRALTLAAMLVEFSVEKGNTVLFINCKSGLDRTGIAYALVVGYKLSMKKQECLKLDNRMTMVKKFMKLDEKKNEEAFRCKQIFQEEFTKVTLQINQPIAFVSTGYRGLKSNPQINKFFLTKDVIKAQKTAVKDLSDKRMS